MANVNTYDIGDAYRLVYTLTDADGNPINATVVLTVTRPDGTTETPTLTNPTVGTYIGVGACTLAGTWLYRFVATGAATDAEPGQFVVEQALSSNVYTTLPELKTALSIPAADTQDDDDLQDAILVASRAVNDDCHRTFHKITEARTLEPGYDLWCLRLGPYNDLVSVTSLKTDAGGDGVYETTWAVGEYQLLCQDGTPNVNAGPEARPYQRVKALGGRSFPRPSWSGGARSDLIEITGIWGWPAVPDKIRRATRMMAAEVFKLRDAPFGATNVADLGIIRVRENPKYQALIRDYRLVEAAVPMA